MSLIHVLNASISGPTPDKEAEGFNTCIQARALLDESFGAERRDPIHGEVHCEVLGTKARCRRNPEGGLGLIRAEGSAPELETCCADKLVCKGPYRALDERLALGLGGAATQVGLQSRQDHVMFHCHHDLKLGHCHTKSHIQHWVPRSVGVNFGTGNERTEGCLYCGDEAFKELLALGCCPNLGQQLLHFTLPAAGLELHGIHGLNILLPLRGNWIFGCLSTAALI
mmetsp:Transcript_47774/g.104019  ORF Transcript_47774/g.104019 Transcript_47774/m.104019 type:complete len:226 (-) Transcript_47774:573-1250(-)